MRVFNINLFKFLLKNDAFGKYSHKIYKVQGGGKNWYCKIAKAEEAWNEVLAQEFFRLIIPHQPETLLAYDEKTNNYFVLSEEASGFKYLPEGVAFNFSNGLYTGLGQVVLTAMFLQETDLKNGNIGLDVRNRVIKIDGDRCFYEKKKYMGKYKITAEGIASLPCRKDYYAFNWLDFTKEGLEYVSSKIVDSKFSNSPLFRAEVNQALFKICLLTDDFIKAFVDAYIPEGGDYYINFLKDRRNALTQAALLNDSFKMYLSSLQAEKDGAAMLLQMYYFKAGYQPIITAENQETLFSEFKARKKFIYDSYDSELQVLIDHNAQSIKNITFWFPALTTAWESYQKKHSLTLVKELNNKLAELEKMLHCTYQLLKKTENIMGDGDLSHHINHFTTTEISEIQDINNALEAALNEYLQENALTEIPASTEQTNTVYGQFWQNPNKNREDQIPSDMQNYQGIANK